MSSDNIKEILESQYLTKVNSLLGFSIDELTLADSKVSIKSCMDCEKEFRVSDFELEEDNLAFFWRACQGLPAESFCAGSEKSKGSGTIAYRFCYNDACIEEVMNTIVKMDTIQAMARARNKTNELCLNRLRHNRKVTDTQITQMFDNLSKSFVSERSHMWHEIDEGLRRFLIMPADKSKNGTQLEGEMINQHGFLIRSFHGHQFRDLIRRNKYNVAQQKPDAIMFGHFHLLAVFRKFDTWVLITGHFTGHHMPREKGFLCHVGAPIMTVELKTNEPFFKLNRARVS